MRNGLLTICVLLLASCSAYDFEQVAPLLLEHISVAKMVKAPRPDVMILLDRSGSMGQPIDSSSSACPDQCGTAGHFACPASCSTRISELRAAMPSFLRSAKQVARFGLALFPANTTGTIAQQCVATNDDSLVAQLPDEGPETTENIAAWAAHAERIATSIAGSLAIGGGTPTEQSLAFLGATSGLSQPSTFGRSRIVLLLTDGLPNCRGPDSNLPNPDPTVVARVEALKANGISTIVIGFGQDVQGAAVLDEMARVGGFARTCRNAPCGVGDSCDANMMCGRSAYAAANGDELKKVLDDLSGQIDPNPCVIQLGGRGYPHVVVQLDGALLPEGMTWERTASNTLTFSGSTCEGIKNSTESAPVNLDIDVW